MFQYGLTTTLYMSSYQQDLEEKNIFFNTIIVSMEAIKREEKNFSLDIMNKSTVMLLSKDKTLSEAKVGTKMRNCK